MVIFSYCGCGSKRHQCRYCMSYRDMRYYGIFGEIYSTCNKCQHSEKKSEHEKKWFECLYVFWKKQYPGHKEKVEPPWNKLLFGHWG